MAPLVFLVASLVASTHAYDIHHVAPTPDAALTTEVPPAAQFSVPLTKKVPRPMYKKNLLKALRGRASSPTAVLAGSDDDAEYLTNITIGGQNFKVIVDTGS